MHRAAVLAFPDDTGEPRCRLVLERSTGPGRTAAWLMHNPSRASHLIDDPTAGRVVHHSGRAGCPRSLVGNVFPLRTPYPVDLERMIAAGELTDEMVAANLEALTMIAGQADIHVVAFGAAAGRDWPLSVRRALEAFSLGNTVQLYCLGTSSGGDPLHPLARGKYAVRNDTELRPWHGSRPGERSWAEVFADKVETEHGTFVTV
jgi:hypothetical protein